MIAIVDYGMGNLKNIYKALKYIDVDCEITSDPDVVKNSDGVVLPGVGAFMDAIDCIKKSQLDESIRLSVKQNKPFLGICLGMQLMFERSYENGEHMGLSLLKGDVRLIKGDVKIPHMGWNSLRITNPDDPLMYGIKDPVVYFVHSYHCVPSKDIVTSTADYGDNITATVWEKNIHGLQFHPEKSGSAGLKMLENFGRIVK